MYRHWWSHIAPEEKIMDELTKEYYMSAKTFQANFLAAKHPHPLDQTLSCRKHVYTVRWYVGQQDSMPGDGISVTKLLEHYFEPFVREDVLARMGHDAQGFHTNPLYCHMNNDQVSARWDQTCKNGKRAHRIIECFLNGMDITPYKQFYVIRQFLNWFESETKRRKIKIFRTEMKIRSDVKLKVTGAIDSLWIDEDHPPPDQCDSTLFLIIIDFKVQEKIEKWAFKSKKGLECCDDVPDCRLNKHSLQQCAYKVLKEDYYGDYPYNGYVYKRVVIRELYLLQLHDSLLEAELIPVVNFVPKIRAIFEYRVNQLNQ